MKNLEFKVGNIVAGRFTDDSEEIVNTCQILAADTTGSLGEGWTYLVESLDGNEAEFYESFEGIPLDLEWLMKFGFDQLPELKFQRADIVVSLWPGQFTINYRGVVIMNDNYRYVHDLQNVWWALIGTELV